MFGFQFSKPTHSPPNYATNNYKHIKTKNKHSQVNKYVAEYGVILQHVWMLSDPDRCMKAIKSGYLNDGNAQALKDLKCLGSVQEVEMLSAGENIMALIDLVPESLQTQTNLTTTLPKANAKGEAVNDHDKSESSIASVVFAPRFIAVLKILLHFNEKKAIWVKVVLESDFVEVLTKARMDICVAPPINDRCIFSQTLPKGVRVAPHSCVNLSWYF